MIRRAKKPKPPLLPWPAPPKGFLERDHTRGSLTAWSGMLHEMSLLCGITFLMTAVLVLGSGPPLFTIPLCVAGLGFFVYSFGLSTWRKVEWFPTHFQVQRFFALPKRYEWSEVVSVSRWSPGTKAQVLAKEFLISLKDGTHFRFTTRRRADAVNFMIALGANLPETDDTELAKPASQAQMQDDRLNLLRTSAWKALGYSFLALIGASVITILFKLHSGPIHQMLIQFPVMAFAGAIAAIIALGPYTRALRAWRDNPAFTDPDRPIELLMYEQYGDLAEPLGRFYRHVWANDAKRLHQLAGIKAKDQNPS